jgi:hypothetical protein
MGLQERYSTRLQEMFLLHEGATMSAPPNRRIAEDRNS